MSIKKGDNVYVRSGDDKGKTGRVLWVNTKKKTILVEGVNMQKKHQKPSQKSPKGGILSVEAPVHLSNVALFVQTDAGPTPTRVRTRTIDEGGKKVKARIASRTGEEI
ncbi:MAG: 50S ribosomal protein L24 [candidate division Zixibacteria bacterium]|nr:50S ribosomal protein L24 [candidate division Zixibacteria bacterium]